MVLATPIESTLLLQAARHRLRTIVAVALGSTALFSFVPMAQAGFEWTPPPVQQTQKAAPSQVPAELPSSSDLMPLASQPQTSVTAQPLPALHSRTGTQSPSTMGNAASANNVPPIDLRPLRSNGGRREHLAALQAAQSSMPAGAKAPPPQKAESDSALLPPPSFVPPDRQPNAKHASASPSPSLTIEKQAEISTEPVAGFGREVPLAMAMRQVVPATYGFSFADGIDPGQRISWSGGKAWPDVLNDALRPQGLSASITPNAVRIDRISSAVASPLETAAPAPIRPTPVSAPPARPLAQEKPADFSRNDQTGSLPRPPVAVTPRSEMKGVDAELLPAPIAAAQTAPASGAPASLVAQPSSAGFPKGLVKASRTEPMTPPSALPPGPAGESLKQAPPLPLPTTNAPTHLTETMPPVTTEQPQNQMDQTSAEANAQNSRPAPAPRITSVSYGSKQSSRSAKPLDMEAVREWSSPAGTTLRRLLTDWSQQAGVQIHWSSQFDYPIQTSIHTTSTYPKAVEMVLDGLRDAKPRPLARLHPNLPSGPAVLIVQTQHVIN